MQTATASEVSGIRGLSGIQVTDLVHAGGSEPNLENHGFL